MTDQTATDTRPHVVRHLGVQVVSLDPDNTTASAAIREDHLVDGAATAGHLAMLIDVVGGVCAAQNVDGAVVTSSLDLHLPRPVGAGDLDASAHVLRAGRRSVVTEVTLTDGDGTRVGTGTVASARLPLRPDQKSRRTRFADDEEPFSRSHWIQEPDTSHAHVPMLQHVGIDDGPDEPSAEFDAVSRLELRRDLTNGNQVLHGGVGALLLDRAAVVGASRVLGTPAHVRSAAIHYLAPGKGGPFVARAQVTAQDGTAVARVTVIDEGQDDRRILSGAVDLVRAKGER